MNKKLEVSIVQKLLDEGLSPKEIGERLKFNKVSIYRCIKNNKLTFSTKSEKDKELQHKIITIFNTTEKSLREISKEFNLSPSRITQILQEYEIKVPTERKNKARERTCVNLFGTSNVMFNEDILKQRENYFLNKLGVDSPFKDPKVLQKAKNTLLERYGVDNIAKYKPARLKASETNYKRLGVSIPAQNPRIREKMSHTYFERTGYTNPAFNPIETLKKEQTSLKKYGRSHHSQIHISDKVMKLRADKERYKKLLVWLHYKKKYPTTYIGKLLGIEYGSIIRDMISFGLEVRQNYNVSFKERDLSKYLRQLSNNVVTNSRSAIGKELDIFLPDLNIAIEFDGLYYHSFNVIPTLEEKNRHYYKTSKCRERGIRLFHILESEWDDLVKQDIWKSILFVNINKEVETIYARKTIIKELDYITAVRFFDENHIQGSKPFTVCYGLYYNSILVGAMSFMKYKDNKWELNRFCNTKYKSIIGGASKLLKHFERNNEWKEVYSFADLRYSYGDLYNKLGFELVKQLPISYYYTDCINIYHKRLFQKQYLSRRLGSDNYNPLQTEFENVLNSGKFRVLFDCGKLKFSKKNLK